MRSNRLRQLWNEGKPAAVGWLSMADTYEAEIMAHAGFDALVLDMQHGMGIGPDRAAVWLQAVSTTETVPLVRVPWNEPVYIQWVLDAGAYGVIVPLVNDAEEAAKAGGASRYPPVGYRSIGPNRAALYGGGDYLDHANDEVVCLVMIEDIRTIDNLEKMAEAPGIDGFYIGPADLAVSIGVPARQYLQDQRHGEACQKVLDVALAHGLVAGVHCASPEEARQRFAQGFKLCPVFMDGRALATAAADSLARARAPK